MLGKLSKKLVGAEKPLHRKMIVSSNHFQ